MYINVDLGEEVLPQLQIEKEVMPYTQACNIACGGHAGTPHSMRETMQLANAHKVKIGAHPSYPDRENFGRKVLDISQEELSQSIIEQLTHFIKIAKEENIDIHHIKAHGALYNEAARNPAIAQVLVDSLLHLELETVLFAPPKSELSVIAKKHHIPVAYEVFGDRAYNDDLSLVNRSEPDAVLTDAVLIIEQVSQMIKHHTISTISGKNIRLEMDTICLHSDHISAVENIKAVNNWMKSCS